MVWSASGTTVTINNTTRSVHSLSDAGGDGVPSTGTSRIAQLDSVNNIWEVLNYLVAFEDGQGVSWEEVNATVIHTGPSGAHGVNFWTGTEPATSDAELIFGLLDDTDPLKPIVVDGCHYQLDGERSGFTNSEYGWGSATGAGTERPGNPKFYGGIVEAWPIAAAASTTGIFWYWPDGNAFFIGVNFTRYGGGRWPGTGFRIQECVFFGGSRLGLSLLSTANAVGTRRLTIGSMKQGYYFSSFQTGDTIFRDTATRDSPMEIAGFVETGYIIDSDEVTELFTAFDGAGDAYEMASYRIVCSANEDTPLAAGAPDAGDPVENVNIRVVRTDPSNLIVTTALQFGNTTSQVLQTNSAGVMVTDTSVEEEIFLVKTHYDSSASTVATRNEFAGFFTTLRAYGFEPVRIPKYPTFGPGSGLVDELLLIKNPFNAATSAVVSAYTGIAVAFQPTATITLTEAHTLQEIYDYVCWYMAQEAQMDNVATGDVWDGTDEVVLPLETQDGELFTLTPGASTDTDWTMVNADTYLDVEDKILELVSGNRYVPIRLTGIPPHASYTITNDDAGDAILYSGTVADDGSEGFTAQRLYTANINVTISARLQGFEPFKQQRVLSAGGLVVAVNLRPDPLYKFSDGRLAQTHYRWRDDDGNETGATWLQTEDTPHTALVKLDNIRLRVQLEEIRGKDVPAPVKLQARRVGDPSWTDVT